MLRHHSLAVHRLRQLDLGSRLNPSLTTVRQQPYPAGLAAATLVIDQIDLPKVPLIGRHALPV